MRAGRFCEAAKSFRGGRGEPGMRGLAGLEIVVVHLYSQPEQTDGEESTGTASQELEKGLHAAAPLFFLLGGSTFIFTPFIWGTALSR